MWSWIEGVYFSQGPLQRQKGRYPGGKPAFVKTFSGCRRRKNRFRKNYSALVNRIADWNSTKQVVVLVSGDPCFFSYSRLIIKKLGRESCIIIPGISSIQLAFAAIGESWDDACFISLHGRDAEYAQLMKNVREHSKVGILTDHKNTPAVIARQLLAGGIRDRQIFICENLSLPEERILETDLASAVNINTNGAIVVIIKKE